jgi:glycosyltransferase involved in cell wall biosynthesis
MLVDLATRPRATGVEHAVALFGSHPAVAALCREAGLRVHERGLPHDGPLPFLWGSLAPFDVRWLERVLREERAGVVHLHTAASQVPGTRAALRCGLPVVRTEHSTRAFVDPSLWPFARWALRRSTASVAVSEHVRRIAERRAPWASARMRVVRNGVDVARFSPVGRRREGPFTFVAVGRLEPRKGLDVAIAALARIRGARLAIVGDGPSRASLEELACVVAKGRVTFHGFSRDPRRHLADADAALCSARSEGLGIALLEAMATGLPVVGFAVGGVPEIVSDGRTGLLTRGCDVASLAEVMNQATANPGRVRALGEAARARVVACFSAAAMCEGYARTYAEVTGAT